MFKFKQTLIELTNDFVNLVINAVALEVEAIIDRTFPRHPGCLVQLPAKLKTVQVSKRSFTRTEAWVQSRKLQGEYLGAIRRLGRDSKRIVKRILKEQGKAAAVACAKRLVEQRRKRRAS
jgi:hypothetical protein